MLTTFSSSLHDPFLNAAHDSIKEFGFCADSKAKESVMIRNTPGISDESFKLIKPGKLEFKNSSTYFVIARV